MNFKMDVKDIINTIVELIKRYKVVLAIFGLITLILAAQDIHEELKKKEKIIGLWEEQLPANHWVKKDPIGVLVPFIQNMVASATTGFDISTLAIGQTGDVGEIMEKVMDIEKKEWRGKYELKYVATGKKVRKIKMGPGERIDLEFWFDGIMQEFDLTEKEFAEKGDLLVVSCTEDAEVATIYDGTISAHNKGKTTLYLYCDGQIWEYTIKVK